MLYRRGNLPMGYFKGMASGSFKKDSLGRTVFFPNGIFGRGRIIENEQTAERFKKRITWIYIVTFIPVFLLGFFFIPRLGWWIIPIVLIAGFAMWVMIFFMVRQYPFSEERLSYVESLRNQAKGTGKITLWILFVLCLVAAGQMGYFTIRRFGQFDEMIPRLALTVLAAACAFLMGWMLRQRGR
ncbi:hypothetical protein MSR1_30170 [Magnetospirillum gryphiswaldense MSR-1]|nr:hypothetical protein MSR1_30170 [Magnetospirillum gryphiswaldense MSR-1]AVM79387.1 hypothetical protein MSR1L_30170 [Magnetospirillum gryphiswaldense]